MVLFRFESHGSLGNKILQWHVVLHAQLYVQRLERPCPNPQRLCEKAGALVDVQTLPDEGNGSRNGDRDELRRGGHGAVRGAGSSTFLDAWWLRCFVEVVVEVFCCCCCCCRCCGCWNWSVLLLLLGSLFTYLECKRSPETNPTIKRRVHNGEGMRRK